MGDDYGGVLPQEYRLNQRNLFWLVHKLYIGKEPRYAYTKCEFLGCPTGRLMIRTRSIVEPDEHFDIQVDAIPGQVLSRLACLYPANFFPLGISVK